MTDKLEHDEISADGYWIARIRTTPQVRARIVELADIDRRTIAATLGCILDDVVRSRSSA